MHARNEQRPLPRHIAMIMDGNGRWASGRGLPRLVGHERGARAVREITTYCRELGIRYLTLYAFSSENWGRPAAEVAGLMALLGRYLEDERPMLLENAIELWAIGDLARLPEEVRAQLDDVRRATCGRTGMRLTLALSYGGRDELVRAMRSLARAAVRGELDPEAIDRAVVERHLDTADMPDPDLLIRTGGEHRVSNFLLWQLAYAELYLTETPWPAFDRHALDRALAWYRDRERRFGLSPEQVPRR